MESKGPRLVWFSLFWSTFDGGPFFGTSAFTKGVTQDAQMGPMESQHLMFSNLVLFSGVCIGSTTLSQWQIKVLGWDS